MEKELWGKNGFQKKEIYLSLFILKSMKKNKYDEIINNIIYFLKSKEGSIYSINHFTETITKQIVSDL